MLGFLKKWIKASEATVMEERRKGARFEVPESYPLKAEVKGVPIAIHDVSLSGLKVETPDHYDIDDELSISLSLEEDQVDVIGKVVYKHSDEKLGLFINYNSSYLNYYYLIAPIVIGSSLKEYPTDKVKQDSPNHLKRVYFGAIGSCLSLWCDENKPDHFETFELELEKFIVQGKKGKLKYYKTKEESANISKAHRSSVLVHLEEDEFQDSIKFFNWLVTSLSDEKIRSQLQTWISETESEQAG